MKARIYDKGFALWLSARDTYEWARRPGSAWPCSELSGHRLWVEFDDNGLVDFTVDGREGFDVPGDELSAIVSDFIGQRITKDHPAYFVAVGQFE